MPAQRFRRNPLNVSKTILLGTLVACIPALSTSTASATGAAQTDGLDWIQGDWCGGAGNERIEEHWLSSHGGLRLGLGRTLNGSRTASFEFLRIDTVDSVITYIAQPEGAPPTAFKRTAGGKDWVRFENPQHDFPSESSIGVPAMPCTLRLPGRVRTAGRSSSRSPTRPVIRNTAAAGL